MDVPSVLTVWTVPDLPLLDLVFSESSVKSLSRLYFGRS